MGVVWSLLKHGVDAKARDANNATPLHLVTGTQHHDVIRLLLQHGADIHARDDKSQTPFMIATETGKHDTMQVLLEYGADGEITTTEILKTLSGG